MTSEIEYLFKKFIEEFSLKEWSIKRLGYRNTNFSWIVLYPDVNTLSQGWKLHVSVEASHLLDVIDLLLPIVIQNKSTFKTVYSVNDAMWIQSKDCPPELGNKVITIYPSNLEKVKKLAIEIDRLTLNYQGGPVHSDRPFKPGSRVSYRWGGFSSSICQTLWGEILFTTNVNQKIILDRRLPYYAEPPSSISNCFDDEIDYPWNSHNLINDRFLPVKVIKYTVSGAICLALDVKLLSRVILKFSSNGVLEDFCGKDSRNRLKHEFHVLSELSDCPYVPKPIAIFELDIYSMTVTAVSDISGDTLHDYMISFLTQNPIPSIQHSVSLICDILKAVSSVHKKGWVLGDLTPTNIIISHGVPRVILIDFETAYFVYDKSKSNSNEVSHLITSGYASPERELGKDPSFYDDVYSSGMILLELITGLKPFEYPIDCLLEEAQDKVNEELFKIIEKSVSSLDRRYRNCADLLFDLNRVELYPKVYTLDNPIDISELNSQVESNEKNFKWYLRAKEICKLILDKVVVNDCWSPPSFFSEYRIHDLRGCAGVVYALSKSIDILDNELPQISKAIELGVDSLLYDKFLTIPTVPGLYVGEGGVVVAFLRAGFALKDSKLIVKAQDKFLEIRQHPSLSFDMYNGIAGQLRITIWLWKITKNYVFLREADKIVDCILEHIDTSDSDVLSWPAPDYNSTQQSYRWVKNYFLGYSHGIAGIADSLIDYIITYKDYSDLVSNVPTNRILQSVRIVQLVSYLLVKLAVFSENNGVEYANWPRSYGEKKVAPAFWCHGSGGIVLFLARAFKYNFLEKNSEVIRTIIGAYQATAYNTHAYGLSLSRCHGLPGNLEILMELKQLLPSIVPTTSPMNLSQALDIFFEFSKRKFDSFSDYNKYDYMNGLPGLLSCCSQIVQKKFSLSLGSNEF